MTNTGDTPTVAAGWYPDHTGEPRMRWWDGQQWTEHVSDPVQPSYGASPVRNTVPASTPVGTIFFWILVFLPLVSTLQQLFTDYTAMVLSSLRRGGSSVSGMGAYSNPSTLLLSLVGYVVIAVVIVLALFDWRTLRARGIDRPFHWAWAFFVILGLGIVYVIGRSVVVHRRSGRGYAPLWVHLGVVVVYLVVTGIKVSQMMSVMFANVPALPNS